MSGILFAFSNNKNTLLNIEKNFDVALNTLSHRGQKRYTYKSNNYIYGGFITNTQNKYNSIKPAKDFCIYDGYIFNYLDEKKPHNEVLLREVSLKEKQAFINISANVAGLAYLHKIKTLYLFRDQLGQKPLVYYKDKQTVIVSSETKALLKLLPSYKFDESILSDLLSFRSLAECKTGFKNVKSCPAGSLLKINLHSGGTKEERFWKPEDIKTDISSLKEAKKVTKQTLIDSLKMRQGLLGGNTANLLLSGGLDSSLIAAVLKTELNYNVNTYNVGFPERGDLSEHTYAKKVSKLLSTNHTFVPLSWESIDVISVISDLFNNVDRPIADPGILPTFIMLKSLNIPPRVFFSGDCVDSLQGVGGYIYKYFKYHQIPGLFRELVFLLSQALPNKKYSFYAQGSKNSVEEMFLYKIGCFHNDIKSGYYIDKKSILKNDYYSDSLSSIKESFSKSQNIGRKYSIFSFENLLPERYAPKLDFASTYNNHEVISPFSDLSFMYGSLRIPYKYKNVKGDNKYVLKQVALDYLPHKLVYRKKMGMYPPYVDWFKTTMFNYLKDTLVTNSKFINRYLNTSIVDKLLNDHKNGKDYSNHIWVLLTLELWGRKYFK